MELIYSIIMGVVQGVTEFLPISSSGHLVITKSCWGDFRSPGILFEILLHLGTLVAIVVYYRGDLLDLVRSIKPGNKADEKDDSEITNCRRLILLIIVSTITTVILAFPFRYFLENLAGYPKVAGAMLMVTGILLFSADRVNGTNRTLRELSYFDAILIGIAQAFAVIPGISRSGATICMAIFLKIEATNAARFSFLMAIPAILLAGIYKIMDLGALETQQLIFYLIGAAISAVVGLIAIIFLISILKQRNLSYFAYYCWAVGFLILIFIGQ